jgi:tight adherence protein C
MSSIMLIVGLGAIGLSLVLIVLAGALGASSTVGVARSLELIEHQQVDASEVSRSELPLTQRLIMPMLMRTRSLADRLSPSGSAARLVRMLNRAGNPAGWTAERIMGAKGALLIASVAAGLVMSGFTPKGLLASAAVSLFAFYLPDILLYNRGVKYQDELRRGLADALDMLTVCVEAGQGFDAALLQVARGVTGPIAGEFARVLSEIQIGKSRGQAFGALAERTTVPEAKNFVSALVQADRLGLPIAAVLREQSVQMRLVRRQLAEEKAQKVPVKILFPIMLGILPALFIVVIGPGAIRIMDAFSTMH